MSLPPGPYAVVALDGQYVAMRDGITLTADVYLPRGAGAWPVLLERTPYDMRGTNHSDMTAADTRPRSKPDIARYFASHGFAVVLQDCRGRYRSGGEFRKYLHEAEDGADTLTWITRQPWCNGRVGTFGLSYGAHVQSALGCLNPPGLASQFLDCGGFSNAHQSGIRRGGAFELKQATWAYKHALLSPRTQGDPVRRKALESQDLHAWFARRPWRRGHSPVSAAPEYEDYLFEQWEHGTFDDYWRQICLYAAGHYDSYADVPMVHLSGWYDPYARTATENFIGLATRKRGPVHLMIGPWTHGRRSESWSGDVDFGSAATFDAVLGCNYFEARRRWFDYTLNGAEDNPFARGRVAIFVMGGGSGHRNAAGRLDHGGYWHWDTAWPLPDTDYRALYLHSETEGRFGRLDFAPPRTPHASRRFRSDPDAPVPTVGGALASGEPIMRAGAFDQRDDARFFGCTGNGLGLECRDDVLAYVTAPLTTDVVIAGPIRVRLWVSSDCVDTDVTVKLIDQYPPSADHPEGFAMNLTDGILRLRYRDSFERPQVMRPGEVYEIVVEAFPTANLFRRGHRIRLDIASSNFPHFDVNPNSGDPEARWQTSRVAENVVHADAARPSHIELPIVPRRVVPPR
jgi:uncharacterized protein